MSDPAGTKVVVSAALSDGFDRRYVVVDSATGEIVDDGQGYGYKRAQNAHRAHTFKSMPPKKKRQREAVKREVRAWCAQHPDVMEDIERALVWALKDGVNITAADVRALLSERRLELPFPIKDFMRHWNW